MSRAIADTSVFIAQEDGRRLDRGAVPDDLVVSVITIGELRAGVLGAPDAPTRSRRLHTLTRVERFECLPVTERVAEAWSELRVALRDAGLRMPANDSWIAATAIAHGLPVAAGDLDYVDVPGLEVIRV